MEPLCTLCKLPAQRIVDNETLQYKGQGLRVLDLNFFECPQCKEQFCDATMDRANAEKIKHAKALIDA